MEPQQPANTDTNGQADTAPPQPQQVVGMPQASEQPAAPEATPAQPPSPAAAPQPTGIPMANMEKEKKVAMVLSFASLAVFVVGFLVGFAALLGAVLGVIGARKSKLIGYQTGFVAGITGAVLNALFYALAVLT